jgi:hypothetical protein
MVSRRALPIAAPPLAVALPPLAVASLVIVNAWPGLMPGVGFWDTGEFQTVLPIMGTAHPTGYPTYVLIGFLTNILLTPIGEPAFRITVLSLLSVATAAGVTVLLVRRLTGSTVMGVAAGLGVALTPVVWLNATRADPHPLHLAFVAILLWALVRWEDARRGIEPGVPSGATDRRLVLAAVVFGLAAGNHSLMLLFVPAIALFVLAVEPGIWRRWRLVLACLGAAFGTVALVYLELPLRGGLVPGLTAPLVYGEPATWDGFWYVALAEQFRGSLTDPFADLPDKLGELQALAQVQLGFFGALLVPFAALVTASRAPRYLLLSGVAFVITLVFDKAYVNADIERYYLGPILIAWTWLAVFAAEIAALVGDGVAMLRTRLERGSTGAPASPAPGRAAVAAAIVLGALLLAPSIADLDARREDADRSKDLSAQEWLDEALPAIAQNAVLVSWWSTSTALWYAQKVELQRPDIFIVDDRTMLDLGLGRAPDVIRRFVAEGRPVYAIRIDYNGDLAELTSQFDMTLVASGGTTGVWRVNSLGVASP